MSIELSCYTEEELCRVFENWRRTREAVAAVFRSDGMDEDEILSRQRESFWNMTLSILPEMWGDVLVETIESYDQGKNK